MSPRILFNDKNLTRTDNDLLSLIISLALKYDYCFASNNYLANYINTSTRTISDSLSKLKRLKYIIIRNDDGRRKIYLNNEKIPTKNAHDDANIRSNEVATDCDHNIKYKNKKEYNKYKRFNGEGIIPYWMEHPEVCKKVPMTKEEEQELKDLINEFK